MEWCPYCCTYHQTTSAACPAALAPKLKSTVTERDCRERERAAFVAGCLWGDKHPADTEAMPPEDEAMRRYPEVTP